MVKIRLKRLGAKKRPFFRVVVADSRSPRDGRFIESIGKYHPLSDPSLIEIDEERALHWLRTGAQPSDSARNLLMKTGIWAKFTGAEPPGVEAEAEEASAEEAPAQEASAEEAPAQEASAEEAPAQEASAEEAPAQEASAEEAPAEEAPAEP